MRYLEYKRNKAKEDAGCRIGEKKKRKLNFGRERIMMEKAVKDVVTVRESREGYEGRLECVKADTQVWKQGETHEKQKHPVFVQSCTYRWKI